MAATLLLLAAPACHRVAFLQAVFADFTLPRLRGLLDRGPRVSRIDGDATCLPPVAAHLAGRAPRRGCTCCCCCAHLPVLWQQMVNTATLTCSPSTHAIPCLLDCGNRWTLRRPSVQSSPRCCAAPQYTYLSSTHAVTDLRRKLLGLRSAFVLASRRPAAPLVSPRSACMTRQLAWFVHRYLTSCRSLFRRRSPLFILSFCYLLNVACHLQRHL